MNSIINLIAIPLGFIMRLIYSWVGNYGLAIVLFTLVTKLILLPVSYKQQKNSARLQLINPKLKKLQEKYKDKPEKMQQYISLAPDAITTNEPMVLRNLLGDKEFKL